MLMSKQTIFDISAQLFTSTPDLAKLRSLLTSLSVLTDHAALGYPDDPTSWILDLARGVTPLRKANFPAGMHPDAAAVLFEFAGSGNIAYSNNVNDPLRLACSKANADVAILFFNYYLEQMRLLPYHEAGQRHFYSKHAEMHEKVLSAHILDAVLAVKNRANDAEKETLLAFLQQTEQQDLRIAVPRREGGGYNWLQIGFLLEATPDYLLELDRSRQRIDDRQRTQDDIVADSIIARYGGAMNFANPAASGTLAAYGAAREENCLSMIAARFLSKTKQTFDDIDTQMHLYQTSRSGGQNTAAEIVGLFPEQRRIIFRTRRVSNANEHLLTHAATHGFYSEANPGGVLRENVDALIKILQYDLTSRNNPQDPLITACRAGYTDMTQRLFETYLGYRPIANYLPKSHWKAQMLDDYAVQAIDYFINTKDAPNRDEMLRYFNGLTDCAVKVMSSDAVRIPAYLENQGVDLSRVSVTCRA